MLRPFMQAGITLALLTAALYVLLFQAKDSDLQRWASGTVGGLVTFWFGGRAR